MDLRESIINQNDVARRLTKQLVQTEGKQLNLVYSPLSIHVVLSLITAGSKGPTQEQLLSFLKSKSTDHLNSFASQLVSVIFSDGSPVGGPKLAFANGLWVHKPLTLKPSFKQVVDASYKAALALVDFQTNAAQVASGVNSWAEKETSGLIKDLLPPRSLDSSTRLIFTNALYFKGAWTEKFDASATKEHDFHLLDGSIVKAPFMTSKRKQYVSAFDGFSVFLTNKLKTSGASPCTSFFQRRKMGCQLWLRNLALSPGFWIDIFPNNQLQWATSESQSLRSHLGLKLPMS